MNGPVPCDDDNDDDVDDDDDDDDKRTLISATSRLCKAAIVQT